MAAAGTGLAGGAGATGAAATGRFSTLSRRPGEIGELAREIGELAGGLMVEAVGELVEAGAVVAFELVDARVGLAEIGGEVAHAGACALQFRRDLAHVGALVAAARRFDRVDAILQRLDRLGEAARFFALGGEQARFAGVVVERRRRDAGDQRQAGGERRGPDDGLGEAGARRRAVGERIGQEFQARRIDARRRIALERGLYARRIAGGGLAVAHQGVPVADADLERSFDRSD